TNDAHVRAGALPSFAEPVDVPAAVHPHVGAQNEGAGEVNEKVVSDRIDALDRAAGNGRVIVNAVERGQNGLEGGDLLARQRAVKCARGTKDRIPLRLP